MEGRVKNAAAIIEAGEPSIELDGVDPNRTWLIRAHGEEVGDPGSDVSKLVAERGGYDLMPEMGYKPVNKYLLPQPRRETTPPSVPFTQKTPTENDGERTAMFSAWADKKAHAIASPPNNHKKPCTPPIP